MTTFTWLHLSDLHLRGTETSVDRAHFDKMLKNIKELCEKEHLEVDAVFFTGDAAYSGQKEQYDQVGKWFDEILVACGLTGKRDRFFIVPGNHDVNRAVIVKPDFVCDQYKTFAAALLDSDSPYEQITKFLGDDEHKEWAFRKFGNFEKFIEEFLPSDKDAKFDHKKYYTVRSISKDKKTIVVIGLNSAWLSFRDDEQGQLLLGARQVCDAVEEAKTRWPNACLHVALVHHPLYWLAEKDIHEVYKHLPDACNILLRGHLHCPSFSIQSTPDSRFYEFAAGASLKGDYHAYNFVRLDLDAAKGTAFVQVQHPDLGSTWGPDSFTYGKIPDGKIEFVLTHGIHEATTGA